jgi:hypothetical protein
MFIGLSTKSCRRLRLGGDAGHSQQPDSRRNTNLCFAHSDKLVVVIDDDALVLDSTG